MSNCWYCGKKINIIGLAFCSDKCMKNYRAKPKKDESKGEDYSIGGANIDPTGRRRIC
jgi:hypothetical protein